MSPKEYSTLEEGWTEIAKSISSSASKAQVAEARKIFYSGIMHLWALLQDITHSGTLPPVGSSNIDVRILNLHIELKKFVAELLPAANGGTG